MFGIVGIRLTIVCENRNVAMFCDSEPSPLLGSLEISRRENFLVMRGPPVRSTRRTEDEFVAVVEDYKSIGRMGGCSEYDTHNRSCRGRLDGVCRGGISRNPGPPEVDHI